MKLSISNIAWGAELDNEMYQYLREEGFEGLEIAPTRIFPESPYDRLKEAKVFADELKGKYGLDISSMQSIWFGKSESIFGSYEERKSLIEYTKKAVDFAAVIGCKNLVFGCPKNRNIKNDSQYPEAVSFFREIGEYAAEKGTVIAIEPNPPIYNTNFINTTVQAFNLAKDINCAGVKVNVDLGTIIENCENINIAFEDISFVNHVHISEPYLEQIKVREMHNALKEILISAGYDGFVSIEMKNLDNLEVVKQTIRYIKEVLS